MTSKRNQATYAILQTGATATGAGTAMDVDGFSDVAFHVTGTFTGTVTFQGSLDGTNYGTIAMYNAADLADDADKTTATAAGLWVVNCEPYLKVRANLTGYSDGSVNVVGRAEGG